MSRKKGMAEGQARRKQLRKDRKPPRLCYPYSVMQLGADYLP